MFIFFVHKVFKINICRYVKFKFETFLISFVSQSMMGGFYNKQFITDCDISFVIFFHKYFLNL